MGEILTGEVIEERGRRVKKEVVKELVEIEMLMLRVRNLFGGVSGRMAESSIGIMGYPVTPSQLKAMAAFRFGRRAIAARTGRSGPPRLCGPAWAPGANSHAPLSPVLSSHPRARKRCAMIAGEVRKPASVAISASF